jgi:hypothetical protein
MVPLTNDRDTCSKSDGEQAQECYQPRPNGTPKTDIGFQSSRQCKVNVIQRVSDAVEQRKKDDVTCDKLMPKELTLKWQNLTKQGELAHAG